MFMLCGQRFWTLSFPVPKMRRARVWLGILIAGAVGVGHLRAGDADPAARLRADVVYLASPALKGRKSDNKVSSLAPSPGGSCRKAYSRPSGEPRCGDIVDAAM
jgi:hypothetical protein